MTKLYPAIPRGQFLAPRRRESPVPAADRSVIVGPFWFCLPELGYCGATAHGIRCTSCNSQLAGHDFGDEDNQP